MCLKLPRTGCDWNQVRSQGKTIHYRLCNFNVFFFTKLLKGFPFLSFSFLNVGCYLNSAKCMVMLGLYFMMGLAA